MQYVSILYFDRPSEVRIIKSGLRPWHVVLAILGVLIVGGVLWMFAKSSNIKWKLAEIRAQGHPTSLAELSEMNQLSPGGEDEWIDSVVARCFRHE